MVKEKKVSTKTVKKASSPKTTKKVVKKTTEKVNKKEAVKKSSDSEINKNKEVKKEVIKKEISKPKTGKTLQVKLIKSPISCTKKQKATVLGLGLTKMHKVVTLEDTSCVRGMINKIIHMVEVSL
jgi:large subunit ribosomal protein L30